jgi:hypothetical protein
MRGVRADQIAPAPVPFDPNQFCPVACFARQHPAGGGASAKLAHKQVQAAYLGIHWRESQLASCFSPMDCIDCRKQVGRGGRCRTLLAGAAKDIDISKMFRRTAD